MSASRGRQRLFSRFSAIAGSDWAQAPPFRGHPPPERAMPFRPPDRRRAKSSGAGRFGKEAADPEPRESAKPAARALVLLDFQRVAGKRTGRWGLARLPTQPR